MNIKSDNYIAIQGWMVTELGLKNTELIVYALIYGFSQDRRSAFTGKLSYLQEWTQASKQTVISALRALLDAGLIGKIEVNVGGSRSNGYYALPRPTAEETGPAEDGGQKTGLDSPKIGPRESKNLTEGVKKFDPDNIDINNNINNIALNTPASGDADATVNSEAPSMAEELNAEFDELWNSYPRKQGKEEARRAYIAARRSGTSFETVKAGVDAYNAKIKAEQPLMRYVIHGGNWFEGRRWEDDNTPTPGDGGAGRREKNVNPALCYKQRKYTKAELKAIGVDFGEDDDE